MTADDEVRNIRWTLGKIHQALYRMNNEFEKALPEVNHFSAKLEQIITDIANESNAIRNMTVSIASNFPNYIAYLFALLILEVTAGIIAIIFIYFIIISFSQLYHKQFIPSDRRRNGKLFRKSDGKDLQKYDAKALIYYSPLSFAPSNISYDKSDKEWWIEMHNFDNRRLLQQEKI
uniref:Transmembrane protein n=1 Tax=Elaeophora elaphi TaxID=1147741 RepID=A0A0R3RK13_9BILA